MGVVIKGDGTGAVSDGLKLQCISNATFSSYFVCMSVLLSFFSDVFTAATI